MSFPKGTYPIRIEWEITTHQKLQEQARIYDEKWFNNQPVPEDYADIIHIPYDRTEEFIQRYNDLLREFNTH